MANQDFDLTVVNQFERPTSSDINTLESQLNRTIRDVLSAMYAAGGFAMDGFLGNGFTPVSAVMPTPGEVGVQLTAGLGFAVGNLASAVNPVPTTPPATGLSDLSRYKPLLLSQDRLISAGAPAAAGQCRRDVVCVTWNRQVDYQTVPIFSAGAGIFAGALRPKNVTFDLASAAVEIVPYGTAPVTSSPILVLRGQEIPYGTEDSFLSANLGTIPAGYLPVAILNVGASVASVAANRIVDYRSLLIPAGVTSASAAINFQTLMTSISTPDIVFPNGGKGAVVYVPSTAAVPEQGVEIYLILGNTSRFIAAGESWNLSNNATPSNPTIQHDRVFPLNITQGVLTLADQQKLAGTAGADWAIAGLPLAAAVGQPYIKLKCLLGQDVAFLAANLEAGTLAGATGNEETHFYNTTDAWLGDGNQADSLGNGVASYSLSGPVMLGLTPASRVVAMQINFDSLAYPSATYRIAGTVQLRRY